MTDQQERYDRMARGYGRWWAPVLRPSAERLLELVDGELGSGSGVVVDVGTGTGTLAIAAVRRFPGVTVIATDASEGMLTAARREIRDQLAPREAARIELRQAFADTLPVADASVDAVISSFVFHLVPSRYRALMDARRVLRPGGRLAYVTWLAGGREWAPDAILDQALDEAGFGPREVEDRPGDVPSVRAATAQLRRAGFHDVRAEARQLRYPFTPESYLGFVEEFDEQDAFESMSRRTRERARRRILEGLRDLSEEARTYRLPIVYATGTRAT
ncbi:MAG TPA: class I SAM-dependent methyltransferase [Candidatus Limnocylindrales bacterium]|nr:class I SAM-dependent methyltransferase [Candidatus Limnocylindrales bacterium]